jgi:hypothetical protein
MCSSRINSFELYFYFQIFENGNGDKLINYQVHIFRAFEIIDIKILHKLSFVDICSGIGGCYEVNGKINEGNKKIHLLKYVT